MLFRSLVVRRTRKTRMPSHYLSAAGNYIVENKPVTDADLPLEFMINAMRLCEGVDAELYQQRTGSALS